MIYTAVITQKGQVTIPKIIRDKLGVKPRGKVVFVQDAQGDVIIQNLATLDQLKGSLNPSKQPRGLTDQDWDQNVSKAIVHDYNKTTKGS